MAKKHVIMRVSALSLVGGALLILASETGRLPLPFGDAPDAQGTSAGVAAVSANGWEWQSVADGFAVTQGMALPAGTGFGHAPVLARDIRAVHGGDSDASVRPAAFAPAPHLGRPGTAAPRPAPAPGQAFSPLGLPCGLDVSATTLEHATIALGIAAPCHPETALRIRHAGLTFGGKTDSVGLLTLDLPAFESPAVVTVDLPDGTEVLARVEIPDLSAYDRVALTWAGDLGLELHAMEGGAGWQERGHVHSGAMRGPGALAEGAGYMTELGTEAGLVQVYTRPRQGPVAVAEVTISVDAPVTLRTCTRRADAALLRVIAGGSVETTPLGLTYPDCDAVGDTLVLQNALRDMRLAAN